MAETFLPSLSRHLSSTHWEPGRCSIEPSEVRLEDGNAGSECIGIKSQDPGSRVDQSSSFTGRSICCSDAGRVYIS